MPNYIGAEIVRPDIHILLFTDREVSAKSYLRSCLSGKIEETQVDAYTPDCISQAIRQKVVSMSKIEWYLNVTCGTKIMALAAFQTFRELGGTIFYVNTENSEVIWFNQGGVQCEPLNVTIDIPTYLKLYGHRILEEGIPQYPRLASIILNNYEKWEGFLKQVRRTDGEAFLSLLHAYKGGAIFGCLRRLGYAGNDSEEWGYQNLIDYMKGFWLEDIVYLKLKATACTDIRMRVKLGWADIRGGCKNEFDVLAIYANKLYFFECKSGKLDQNDLHKLEALREVTGGTFGRAFLICTQADTGAIRERLRDFREVRILTVQEFLSFVKQFENATPLP